MVLEEELGAFGFQVAVAENANKGISYALNNIPDLITVDLTLNGVSGIDVITKLRGSKQTCDIPILVVTGDENQVEKEHALSLGVIKIFKKPFELGEVGEFVNKHFHYSGKNVGRRRILLVEDSETIRAITKYLLTQQGHIVIEASDGVGGWEILNDASMALDMVITDINMPRMNGQDLVAKIRSDNRFQFIPIIVSSTISEKESIKLLLKYPDGQVAETVYIPFTVGGGIRTIEDIQELLRAGCDKVSMNTAALDDVDLVRRSSRRFGSQCIVVAIDAKQSQSGSWKVFTHGGRKETKRDAIQWAQEVESKGAGEILLTSMDRDGTKEGYDLELTRRVSESVRIPVIASGGAGELNHLEQAFGIELRER